MAGSRLRDKQSLQVPLLKKARAPTIDTVLSGKRALSHATKVL